MKPGKSVNLALLTTELSLQLNRSISILQSEDSDVRVIDPSTGQQIEVPDKVLTAVFAAHDAAKVVESPEQQGEREVNEMLTPMVAKAKRIQGGSTTTTFTAAEMQMILAAVVLRPRNRGQ